jgi:monothiol glutaredoxin
MSNPTFDKIESDLSTNDVVLYMKGTKDMPMCGFSGAVVMILSKLSVDFKDINILEDDELRQGIKDYTNWPTIPQLYVKKEFVGGCDIVKEMFLSGELIKLLSKHNINFKAQ